MIMYGIWSCGGEESDRINVKLQEERAKILLKFLKEGCEWGPWRADLNNELFRLCNRCHRVDETMRTPEQSI